MSSSSDSGSPLAGSIRFRRLRLAVALLGCLAIVAFDGLSAYDAWRLYRRTQVATDREISNVARALAEQTAWTWQTVDLLLREVARWYRNDSPEIAPELRDDALAKRTAGVPQV